MSDWLMENGSRTEHYGGEFAYDTDNDAWCEMGSTPGSTPVWWRNHGSDRSAYASNYSEALEARKEQLREEIAVFDKRIAEKEAVLKELEAQSTKPLRESLGKYVGIAATLTTIALILILVFTGNGIEYLMKDPLRKLFEIIFLGAITFLPTTVLLGESRKQDISKKIAPIRQQITVIKQERDEKIRSLDYIR